MSSDPRPESPAVVALVMAAGVSRRFGGDKRRATLPDGRTLLATTLNTVARAYPRWWLVTRPEDDLYLGEAFDPARHRRLVADQARHGLGGSLGDAFRHLIAEGDTATAAAVVLADMPWLSATTCTRLQRHADAERIVIPSHRGRRGHPVLFGRRFWPTLAALEAGDGARAVVQANRAAVSVVDVDDDGIWRDIDTPQDLPEPP
ncbi:nucleotidyltransferase family protein [Salinicola sp. CR57]|uniref:nucleotidyltransferase family protein n=1 Tax=Salinicola sp. CR57 TaxID=1949086 RepID=UPI000DA1DC92|nr:nucleotidyltransferase family protein [Salinicola sp. CR57]